MTQEKPPALTELEQLTGLSFIQIPAGTYKVGIEPEHTYLALAPRETSYRSLFIPPTSITLPTFFISEDLVRLSHWQKLQRAEFATALNACVTPDAIRLYHDNLIRDIQYGMDLGFKQCAKDIQEANPALTLPFTMGEGIAQILGMTLPTWTQWEVAARGEQAYLFPWGNEWNLDRIQLSYLPYTYTWEDPQSTMGLFRERESRSGRCCRVDAFGDYTDAVSPFGLKGLLHYGVEWNRIDPTLPKQPKEILDLKRIVRSLCDLGDSRTLWTLSESEAQNQALRASDHRSFSGVPLPLISKYPDNYRIGAFRLVYVPSAAPDKQTAKLFVPSVKQPDWALYNLLGCTSKELIDYLGEPDAREEFDFSTGASCLMVFRLFYYSRGIKAETECHYSRMTWTENHEERIQQLEFWGNTTRQFETRHEFLTYARPIYDGISIGTPRAIINQSDWHKAPQLQGIEITRHFDNNDRLSRAVLKLNAHQSNVVR